MCVCGRKRERKGRHQKDCLVYRLYDSLSEKRVYALCVPEEGRATSVVGDRVGKTLSVARARDHYNLIPHDNEETSASIYNHKNRLILALE